MLFAACRRLRSEPTPALQVRKLSAKRRLRHVTTHRLSRTSDESRRCASDRWQPVCTSQARKARLHRKCVHFAIACTEKSQMRRAESCWRRRFPRQAVHVLKPAASTRLSHRDTDLRKATSRLDRRSSTARLASRAWCQAANARE